MKIPSSSFAHIENLARQATAGQKATYGYAHVRRVARLVEKIHEAAGGDLAVAHAAALLHHMAGEGEAGANAEHSAVMARQLLIDENYDEAFGDEVADCIKVSPLFRRDQAQSHEAQLLWDANQLDFVGMVGLARLFALGGEEKAPLFGSQTRPPEGTSLFGDPPASVEAVFGHRFKGLPHLLFFDISRDMAKRRIELAEAFFARAEAECQLRR